MEKSDSAGPRELINADGSSFAEELEELRASLAALPNDERVAYRDRNASAVAQHAASHLLVVAGPGAGKSFLFLDRIRHWLDENESRQIYVASFVRKLVADLENEIATRIGDEGQKHVTATTLHALARSIIERNGGAGELSLQAHVKVISPPWDEMVWRDVRAFHSEISGDYSAADMRAQFQDDEFSSEPEWIELLATYDRLRAFYNAVGFADMIVTARQAVEESQDLVEHEFWIFDEFQDFNTAEEHLVGAVTKNSSGLLVAGDDEQALYQALKGSHPEIIVAYYENPAFAKAMLPYCSRCSYYICLAACAFIEHHRGEAGIAKAYIPIEEDTAASKVQVVAAAMPTSAVDYVRTFLDEHREQLDAHEATMEEGSETDPFLLILSPSAAMRFFRTKDADVELFDLLQQWSGQGLHRSEDYWKVATYCSAAWNPTDNFTFRKVLRYEGVPYAVVHELLVVALDRGVPLSEVESGEVRKTLERCQQLAEVIQSDELEPHDIAERCAGVIAVAHPERLASEFEADPIARGAVADEGGAGIEAATGTSVVELMSIVGAKGLSAKHVIVLGCDDRNLATTTQLAFYVALTRARESLHLVTAAKAGGASAPHEFVLEIPEDYCDYVVHRKSGPAEHLDSQAAFGEKFRQWGSFAKR